MRQSSRISIHLFNGLLCLLILPATVFADVAPRTRVDMEQDASHIVVGKLVDLEVKQETKSGNQVDLVLTYTLEVTSVEKGAEVAAGDRIQVVAGSVGRAPSEGFGMVPHSPLPAVGEDVRVYLQRGFEYRVMLPNGFAAPGEVSGMTEQEFDEAQYALPEVDLSEFRVIDDGETSEQPGSLSLSRWYIVGGVLLLFVLLLVGLALALGRSRDGGDKSPS